MLLPLPRSVHESQWKLLAELRHLFPASYPPREIVSGGSSPATVVWLTEVVPGLRLSMRCTSPAILVTFCALLWISNLVQAQDQDTDTQLEADCEGEPCVTCLRGGDTTLSPAVTKAFSPGPSCK